MLELGRVIAWALVALGSAGCLEAAEGESLALWEKSINARGALGYKDNVLLSDIQREGSAFWQSALDLSLFRLSLDDGPAFTFFASGEDRRYFSSRTVQKEQLLLAQGRFEQPFLTDWKGGLIAQYLYADQVFDASATEELLQTLPVKSHNLLGAPFLSRTLPAEFEVELRFNLERQLFNQPLDDYWEIGPQLTLKKKYGHKSEVSLSYTYEHRAYDARRQIGLDNHPIPDTSLRFDQHEFEASLNHSWDASRRWRSRLRFLFEVNRDNGPGFYDYYRYRWSKRFGYYAPNWLATIEGKILHYDYSRQPVIHSTEIRSNWEYVLALHLERTVWKKVKLFAESEHEISRSNYRLEEYAVNTVLGGFDWEF